MRKWIVLIAMVMILMASTAFAEQKNITKDEACALLGSCGDDVVKTAMAMKAECKNMMTKAEELIKKGKMIRGQGQLWQDKEMETEGESLYNLGKAMMEKAKTMNDACDLIIAQGEKTKKKYKKQASDDKPEKVPAGDHVPY